MSLLKIYTPPNMGRAIIDHDERNRNYPARGRLFYASAPLFKKTWRGHHPYDQGNKPHCVAYSGKGMLNRLPFSKGVKYRYRYLHSTQKFYDGAQARDQWPGVNYDGTSALGLLRYLTEVEIISEYRWCFGLEDVLRTLVYWGPVSVGSWWTTSMNAPQSYNNYRVAYNGEKLGGHQWTIIGIDPADKTVECMNSWGIGWGDEGRFRMSFDDLEKCLHDEGDAYTLVTVKQNLISPPVSEVK